MSYPTEEQKRGLELLATLAEALATGGALTKVLEAGGALTKTLETGGALTKVFETGGALTKLLESGGDLFAEIESIKTALQAGGGTEAALQAIAAAIARTGVELLYTNTADSTEAGNSFDEQFFDALYVLAAGKGKAGDEIEIDFDALVSGAMGGGGNATFQIYVGTQVVYTSGAFAAAQNDRAAGKVRIKLRAANAAVVEEISATGAPGTAVATVKRTTGLTIDPAVAQTIRMSVTFAVADAGNVAKLQDLAVRVAHI